MAQVTTFNVPADAMAFSEAGAPAPMSMRQRAGLFEESLPLDRSLNASSNAPGMAVAGTPAGVLEMVRHAFSPVRDTHEAERFTRRLAQSHYENFSVISLLLPRYLRQDFCNIYAFCRVADDLADEVGNNSTSLGLLRAFREQTLAMYAGDASSAVFAALAGTVARHHIPISPFLDLINAFEQDQRVARYETFEQLTDYCRRSANPVGRLVLFMCGYRDEQRQQLSDQTCTALQLANFWQDVRRDLLERDRIYLPAESMDRFGTSEEQIREGIRDGKGSEAFCRVIRFEVERAGALLADGRKLLNMLDPAVRRQIALFGDGGAAILKAISRQRFDTIASRPTLSRWQKGRLVFSALMGAVAAQASTLRLSERECSTPPSQPSIPGEKGTGV